MSVKTRAAAFALAAGVLLGCGAVLPATAATPAPAPSVGISVAPQDPGALEPKEPLRLSVTITNPTSTALAAGVVTAAVSRVPLSTRAELGAWLGSTSKSVAASVHVGHAPVAPVAPGETRSITLSVAASALGFGPAGVYALAIRFAEGSQSIATARTAVVWKVGGSSRLPLTIAEALTVPASPTGFLDAATLEEYTGPNGLLTRQLDAALDSSVALGIDPRIIASIRVLGNSAPPSAVDWLARLAAAPNDTFPLTWADADLTVQSQAAAKRVLGPPPLDFAIDPKLFAPAPPTAAPGSTATAQPTAESTLPPLPDSAALVAWNYTLPGIAWPAADTVVKDDLKVLKASGYSTILLSSGNVSRDAKANGAAATVNGTPTLVSDATLSAELRSAVTSPTIADWSAAMARLSAAAALDSELGSGSITLATIGRDWAGGEFRLRATLDALYSRPWVVASTVTAALGQTASSAKLAEKKQDVDRVRLASRLLDTEAADARFAGIADDPQAISAPRRLELLSLLSNEWGGDAADWRTAADTFLTESRALRSSVEVVESSTINFLNSRGTLPVTVSNTLSEPVTVFITVSPQTPLISVDDSRVMIRIEPKSQSKAQIPVQSISNGTVVLNVSLSSASGVRIGQTIQVEVNVQAGWETAGTIIFAILVVAVFAFGLFRNIRKRRRAARD